MQTGESKVPTVMTHDPKLTFLTGRNDGDMSTAIMGVLEESQQIMELLELEKEYSTEVAERFRKITMSLNESYHVKPESVLKYDSSVSDVILTAKGDVCVFRGSNSVTTFPLESMTCETLIRILEEVIPKAEDLLKDKQRKIGNRVTTLERLVGEIRKVIAASSTSGRKSG